MESLFNFDSQARGFRLTTNQISFISEGSYGFKTRSGKSYYRHLEVIAQNPNSGEVVIKETYCGDYTYEKCFLLSREGRPEKIKSLHQSNPIKNRKPKPLHDWI
jgi:hypothetical protein